MKWSNQQQSAINSVYSWFKHSDKQIYRLFGYAGVGKTTLAKEVASLGTTLFCAFTGKAAYVLRQKGCEAFTIHQLIYQAKEKSRDRLKKLEEKLENTDDPEVIETLEKEIAFEHKRLNSPSFILNPDSPVKTADLVVVDECSMVNAQMAEDLMSFGTKILNSPAGPR